MTMEKHAKTILYPESLVVCEMKTMSSTFIYLLFTTKNTSNDCFQFTDYVV